MKTQGYVRVWHPDKGYGFLVDQTGQSFFVHITGLRPPLRELQPDQTVEFEVETTTRGPRAIDVFVIE